MKRVSWVVVMAAATLVLAAQPALAVGPDGVLDGLWQVDTAKSNGGVNTAFLSVHENDSFLPGFNVLVIQVDPNGTWGFGFATRNGTNVQGSLFLSDGTAVGSFTVTLTSSTTFSGQSTIGGVTRTFNGTKLF